MDRRESMFNSAPDSKSEAAVKKPDRRTRRSQTRLFEALMELIREKPYESVTVSEIAERADVARATFYLHYDDKDALLLSSLDALVETIIQELKGFSQQDLLSGAPHPALIVFEVVQRDPDLFRVILKGQGGNLMLGRLRHYGSGAAHQAIRTMGVTPSVPPAVIADFMAGAMLSVLTGWVEEDMKTPPGEMARMFYSLVRPGILSVLSLDKKVAQRS